jgi:acetyl esterase/lipase
MAINKAMRAALALLSYSEPDIKKDYPYERQFQEMTSRRRRRSSKYTVTESSVYNGDHAVPIRIFMPKGKEKPKIFIFYHGGGWVKGSIDSYDAVCADMTSITGRAVISVDYRLAPEHPFPAGVEDCYAVTKAVFAGDCLIDADYEDIVLIGDSAGGNLAAAVSLMARDTGEFLPGRQILIYPAVGNDYSDDSPFLSVRENGTDYLLTTKRIRDYMSLYRSSEEDLKNAYFAPLMAEDFSHQPETLIITAQYCPLRDEGEAYGMKLLEAGNHVEIYRMPNALHGYFSLPARFVHVKRTYELIQKFLMPDVENSI